MIINAHAHIFTDAAVPESFLPFGLVRTLSKNKISSHVARVLTRINPFSDHDIFDRFALFLKTGASGSEEKILEDMAQYYPSDTRFVLLSMDMTYMGCGSPQQSFEDQCGVLARIKASWGDRVLPFVCVDPRRPAIIDFVKTHIEKKGFAGIKLYPPLGFFPYDRNLAPVWQYAERNKIPVIAHVSREGVYRRGKITADDYAQSRIGRPDPSKMGYFAQRNFFTHPAHYRELLTEFPSLKISLAHAGGAIEWFRHYKFPKTDSGDILTRNWFVQTIDIIRDFPTAYTDIAYTLAFKRFYGIFNSIMNDPVLRKKIMYGTDFYLDRLITDETAFSERFKNALSADIFEQISYKNPKEFLGIP
jgi:predicted TIM-barrel fold metal-dependent hydrolase